MSKLPVTLPDGQQAPLGQLIRPGLPTVISLWASWCGPCQLEAPDIVELRRHFGPDKINLVYLNVREDGAPPADLARFLRSIGMPPHDYVSMGYADLPRLTNDTRNLIPRTFVFDKAGTPIAMIVGYKPMALARIPGLLSD
ncbi:TlpA disulfide reductase family protein [Sphingomonas sp. CV7422]|uniref:TlpA disulfide reductase family protein n=1 Tax=Sphingomonas sp. CV7422 TaxID=3018036 RepID=UPI0022FF048B|nr:TlpA disulfide reductase family protein [Sphingomonas sp. CV7422]